jgi:ABC-type multidrug transport system ATPase subunit
VIAAVLALEPQILIFDEPTTGQDWRGAMAIVEMLRTLNERGKTTVLITHHLYLLPGFAERLVVMDAGKIALDGPLRDVLYDREGLESSGLIPPHTVRFVESFPSLRALRPLGPDDLAELLAVPSGVA